MPIYVSFSREVPAGMEVDALLSEDDTGKRTQHVFKMASRHDTEVALRKLQAAVDAWSTLVKGDKVDDGPPSDCLCTVRLTHIYSGAVEYEWQFWAPHGAVAEFLQGGASLWFRDPFEV